MPNFPVNPPEEPTGPAFNKSRLGEWMKLAARHAPPSSKHRRQSRGSGRAGGLQELYYHSVRRYLTEANMTEEDSTTNDLTSERRPPLRILLLKTALAVGVEGTILHAKLLQVQAHEKTVLEVGQQVRLLLHTSHPLLQERGATTSLEACDMLRLDGYRLLADVSQARGGPLLLPLKASWLKRDTAQYPYSEVHESRLPTCRARSVPTPFSGVRKVDVPIPVWECLDDEAMGCSPVIPAPLR